MATHRSAATQQALDRIDGWVRESRERAETARRLASGIEAVKEKETSRDRAVTVSVDAAGRLVDLVLRESAMELRPSDLASTIMETISVARDRAGRKASQLAQEAWGEESEIAKEVIRAYEPASPERSPDTSTSSVGIIGRPGSEW